MCSTPRRNFVCSAKLRACTRWTECHGRDAALFQEIAGGARLQRKQAAFHAARATAAAELLLRADSEDIEAILFGVAGFLESPDLGIYETDTSELRSRSVGSLVATARQDATPHFAQKNLALERRASAESSAAATRCPRA